MKINVGGFIHVLREAVFSNIRSSYSVIFTAYLPLLLLIAHNTTVLNTPHLVCINFTIFNRNYIITRSYIVEIN